ncbi:MAG TPA: ELM1/GtrOC1 family putative glycosyltransferase [Terriglobales bacterium]|nr:ELM1/GtrOC1 family putative glycosyltransferase [Terriglobales bacterium]
MAGSLHASTLKRVPDAVALQGEADKISSQPGASQPAPRIWLLLGDRHGDNAQLRALDATLSDLYGWQSQTKQLHFDLGCATPHRDRGSSLIGLDPESRSELQAPWPDIVLAAGKSAASVCRWIRKRSGGRTIIVLLGRPRVAYRHFDLIIATPQFGMPQASNIAKCCLPITWQDEAQLAKQGRLWESAWHHLPRPWTAVLVGGSTAQMNFDTAAARSLLDKLAKYQQQHGGSLLLTTSPRTPIDVTELINAHLPQPNYVFAWQPGVPNPLQAMLAWADNFIVTIDSVSMVAEAANRMKPLYYFSLPRPILDAGLLRTSWSQRLRRRRQRRRDLGLPDDILDRLADILAVTGYLKPRNDYTSLETVLQQSGIAKPLDAARHPAESPAINLVERERIKVAEEIALLWQKATTLTAAGA